MFVIKVQHGEVTRRLVLQEPYSYQSLLQTVLSRFELNPAQTRSAQLRYIDPDGDLISMNTDAELSEAFALVNQSEAQPVLRLKLVINAYDAVCESPASEESVVFVSSGQQVHGSSSLNEEVKARLEETAALEAQIQEVEAKAQAQMLRLEEERLREEEKRLAEEAEKARRLAEEAEKARRLAEEAEKARRLAEEAEKARLLQELEEARLLAEERERIRMEEEQARAAQIALEEKEKARAQEMQEMLQRCEIAISAEREDSLTRISSLLRMGCTIASLESIFSEDLIKVASKHVASDLVENQLESFVDCVEAAVEDKGEALIEAQPEPKVDWELQKALKVQESLGESFPSTAQKRAVLEAGNRAQNLATQLTEFYLIHNPDHVSKVPELVKLYQGREAELNRALQDRYRCDLASFRMVAPVQTPQDDQTLPVARVDDDCSAAKVADVQVVDDVLVIEPNSAMPNVQESTIPEASAPEQEDDKLSAAISILVDMGIEKSVEIMKEVLEKYDYNVEAAIPELLA